MKLNTLWKHIGAWMVYCTLYILQIGLGDPGYVFYPQNMAIFFFVLATIFYTSSLYLFPKFLPIQQYIHLGIGILALSVGFILIRYLCVVEFYQIFNLRNGKMTPERAIYGAIWLTLQHVAYGWGYYSIRREKERYQIAEARNKLENEKINLEVSLLKSQFNPHFLYNTLNHIYSQLYTLDEKLASGVLKLASILRYSLEGSPVGKVALEEEVKSLHDFIDIHKMRFGENTFVSFESEGEMREKKILPLILISFVENAFKHGDVSKQESPLQIKLAATQKSISFAVKNRKRASQLTGSSTGIGMENVKRRLALTYNGNHSLQVHDELQYFTCELMIKD